MKLTNLEFYTLADAKAKFSQVIEETKDKNIVITKSGKPESVIIDYDKFVRMMEFLDEIRDLYVMEAGDVQRLKELEEFFTNFEE